MMMTRTPAPIPAPAAFAFALAFALAGCRDQTPPPPPAPLEPGVFVGEHARPIHELEGDGIIVSVNGAALTRRRYDQLLALNEALYKMGRPNANRMETARYLDQQRRMLPDDHITRQLLLQEAGRRGLHATEEGRAGVGAGVRQMARRQNQTLDQVCRAMGDNGTLLQAIFAEDALINTLRLADHGGTLRVTEADIDEALARAAANNALCAATNRLVMARGRLISKYLREGADFGRMAAQFSEDGEAGADGEWGVFYPNEIEDPDVRKAALELPIGAVSEPFDTEEGLVIIKVLGREGMEVESLAALPLTVRLGRILLRLADGGDGYELPTRDETRRILERRRLAEANRAMIPPLRAAARIEYPNGTNFWPRAAGPRIL